MNETFSWLLITVSYISPIEQASLAQCSNWIRVLT